MLAEQLKLGFVTARSAYWGADGVWANVGVGRPVEVWAGLCRRFTMAISRSPDKPSYLDHCLDLPADDLLPLPWLSSIGRSAFKGGACRSVIREVERRSDVVIVQLPFAAPLALIGARRPRVYHLAHDIWGVARQSTLYRGWRRPPALAIGGAIDRLQCRLLHRPDVRAVTNGRELLAHYGNPAGRAVVSASLYDAEIASVARRRPPDAPFRVLFVGHLRPEKGIDVLLDAFDLLLGDLPDAELVIVGPKNTVDRGMSAFIEGRLAELRRRGNVEYQGPKAFGPELFACYADADVLALSSRAEGTPRVLVEARAMGCPVVGSRAGGIPTSIDDGVDGLLVPIGDAAALKAAMLRIARDRELRERLVAGGYSRARQSTVESFARQILDEALTLATANSGAPTESVAARPTTSSATAE